MSIPPTFPWALHAVALAVYAGLIVHLQTNRLWDGTLKRRFLLYVILALIGSAALVLFYIDWAFVEIRLAWLRIYLYAQAALPLFYLATARAFTRLERRLWGYAPVIGLLIALIAVDVGQMSFEFAARSISSTSLVVATRALVWFICNGMIVLIGAREFRQLPSPLHRNRLTYLALASIFLFADGALEMLGGVLVRPLAITFQMIGILIFAYAAPRHTLIDLWMFIRRGFYFSIVTLFTLLVYFAVIQAALWLIPSEDPSRNLIVALASALALTLVYQPLYDLVRRLLERVFFGQRYDVQAVVAEFSQRLSARIELEEFAQEGRGLLKSVLRARDAHLLICKQEADGYGMTVLAAQPDLSSTIRLASTASIVKAWLKPDVTPVLQYDIDRLAEYRDLSSTTRTQLQKLQGEVYLPVKSGNTLIGVWVVGAKTSGDRYSENDLALLSTLAKQSVAGLENARLLADLRTQMIEVRAMRDYLDSTMASIATGVLTLSRDGKIISINRAAESILRVSAKQAIGKAYGTVLPNLEGAQLSLLIARLWAHNAQHLVRDAVTQVDGRGTVHLTLHLSAMRRGDEMVGIAIVIEDLTEQARLEQERRAEEQEKQRVRATFEHYVAPTVVEGLLADPRRVQLGGERQPVTILFADIHGFSGLSEQLPPEELVEVLNGYLSVAYRAILRYEGTIDKYMGDGMMAIFNAPLPQVDHPLRAASAALALHKQVDEFAQHLPRSQRLTFRIGLHTGEVIIGNIGTRDLMNYTAIGDTVNVAKRLQENAGARQTLMSRSTFDLIQDRVTVTQSQVIVIKGRLAPVEVFDLAGVHEDEKKTRNSK